MFFLLWLKRFFFSRGRFVRFTPLVSILSLMLAVATLILTMSVYSGYETTMKQAIMDIAGHLVITGRKNEIQNSVLVDKIPPKIMEQVKTHAVFLSAKSLLVSKGKLSGVLLKGVSPHPSGHGLKKRLIAGRFDLQNPRSALIGRGATKKFNLKPGDVFYVVVPRADKQGDFHKKQARLYVAGVLDMGFHDFNSRYILVNIKTVQSLLGRPAGVGGLRLWIKDPAQAEALRLQLTQALGPSYKVHDWRGVVKNLHQSYFEAVRKEKFLIFFILMVLVLAGAFNVSSHLSISVLNQVREISILKVMGARRSLIFFLLLTQGLLVSLVGATAGTGLGWALSKGFVNIQSIRQIIPSDVYKVNTIITDLRFLDIALIFVCALAVCVVSCLLPAYRALQLSLREGLLCE